MKKRLIRPSVAFITIMLLAMLFCPWLPWSARSYAVMNRLVKKSQVKIATLQGQKVKHIAIAGRIIKRLPNKQPLAGIDVAAIESISGWATLTDASGSFLLPDVLWYPGIKYTLLITVNEYQIRQLELNAQTNFPQQGIVNVGELSFEDGREISQANLLRQNSISHLKYDISNISYYQDLFNKLTANRATDEEKIEAINNYVAARLVISESPFSSKTPFATLSNGSSFCGDLALALATIAEAGNYKTRLIDMLDGEKQASSHMVTEIYYGDRWHLYDPTAGLSFRNADDSMASYKELAQEINFKFPISAPRHQPRIVNPAVDWMASLYHSGIHHCYYLDKK